jgi:carbonic anhydrase
MSPDKPSAEQVRAFLTEGNLRFVQNRPRHPHTGLDRRRLASTSNQAEHALATVLTCSDSRVPVEHIFDAGIMDLFVVRVAGNIIGPNGLASLEYGVLHVHTPLLLVLGHSDCGAVGAALNLEQKGEAPAEENVVRLLSAITPVVRRVAGAHPEAGRDVLLQNAVKENVRHSLAEIFRLSPALAGAARAGEFTAAGAVYDLATGMVHWLEGDPAAEPAARGKKPAALGADLLVNYPAPSGGQ